METLCFIDFVCVFISLIIFIKSSISSLQLTKRNNQLKILTKLLKESSVLTSINQRHIVEHTISHTSKKRECYIFETNLIKTKKIHKVKLFWTTMQKKRTNFKVAYYFLIQKRVQKFLRKVLC